MLGTMAVSSNEVYSQRMKNCNTTFGMLPLIACCHGMAKVIILKTV